MARAYNELFCAEKDDKKKREAHARAGTNAANKAVELDPTSAAAHRWKGIALG